MLMPETIESFCSDDPVMLRGILLKPFNVGAYTYAADRTVAIRIDRREKYDDNPRKESIVGCGWMENVPETLYESLPAFDATPELITCPDCKGETKNANCSDCDGDGNLCWYSRSGIRYEEECDLCNGTGKQPVCELCDGAGKIQKPKWVDMGTKRLNVRLLEKMARLPNVKIATEAVDGLTAIPFRFDGGIGIVMPMRKEVDIT